MINTMKSTCKDTTLLGTFLENHDNPRFASYVSMSRLLNPTGILTTIRYTADMSLAKNAAAFNIMADGIPIIYAGQEQHYDGGSDPENREAVWLSGYDANSALYKLIAQTNAIRSHAISKNSGYITYKVSISISLFPHPHPQLIHIKNPIHPTKFLNSSNNISQNYPIYQDTHTLAMRKGLNGSQTITVLSNLGAGGDSYKLSLPNTEYAAGMALTEIITCANVTVDASGNVPVPMASGQPRILYPSL